MILRYRVKMFAWGKIRGFQGLIRLTVLTVECRAWNHVIHQCPF